MIHSYLWRRKPIASTRSATAAKIDDGSRNVSLIDVDNNAVL